LIAVFFVVAVTFACYSLAVAVEWHGFFIVSLLWVMVSSFLASKAVRDRDFAKKTTSRLVETDSEQLPDIMWACTKSPVYQIVVWSSAVFAVGTTLIFMWSWDEDNMEPVMKGFFSLCVFFGQGSTFHLGKLLHDRSDPIKARELQENIPFQVFKRSLTDQLIQWDHRL